MGICRVQDFRGLHKDDSILGSMLDHIRGTPYALSKELECEDPPRHLQTLDPNRSPSQLPSGTPTYCKIDLLTLKHVLKIASSTRTAGS